MSSPINKVVYGMTDEEYFSGPGLSQSTLKKYLVSPYKAKFDLEDSEISMESKLHGYGLECILFEGRKAFENKYCVSQYKTYCDSMIEEGIKLGKTPLTKSTYEKLIGVEAALPWNEEALRWVIAPGDYQAVLYFEHEGIQCRAKLDKLIKTNNGYTIIDAKSFSPTDAISTESLGYHCKRYGYDVQAWFYMLGVMKVFNVTEEEVTFINLFVEKHKYPEILDCAIGQENIDAGKIKVDYAIGVYKQCQGRVVTLKEMLLNKQNALEDVCTKVLTIRWPEKAIPGILL